PLHYFNYFFTLYFTHFCIVLVLNYLLWIYIILFLFSFNLPTGFISDLYLLFIHIYTFFFFLFFFFPDQEIFFNCDLIGILCVFWTFLFSFPGLENFWLLFLYMFFLPLSLFLYWEPYKAIVYTFG
ncbi:unnamed protein product, partial [Rangifer tarandus platyrhynchus]